MGVGDDIRNNAEKLVGKAKEGIGNVTGNEDLENEGRREQVKADAKKAVDDAKDAAAGAAKQARDAFER